LVSVFPNLCPEEKERQMTAENMSGFGRRKRLKPGTEGDSYETEHANGFLMFAEKLSGFRNHAADP
jgi:hypothetical protein